MTECSGVESVFVGDGYYLRIGADGRLNRFITRTAPNKQRDVSNIVSFVLDAAQHLGIRVDHDRLGQDLAAIRGLELSLRAKYGETYGGRER